MVILEGLLNISIVYKDDKTLYDTMINDSFALITNLLCN